jgi:hypothetical protein
VLIRPNTTSIRVVTYLTSSPTTASPGSLYMGICRSSGPLAAVLFLLQRHALALTHASQAAREEFERGADVRSRSTEEELITDRPVWQKTLGFPPSRVSRIRKAAMADTGT